MILNPPIEICGPLAKADNQGRSARSVWINSLPNDFTVRQIANALGVSADVVAHAVPGRFTKTPSAVAPIKFGKPLAAPLPFEIDTSHRAETAPRAGIMSPPRSSDRAAAAIETIRQLHAEWVAA